MNLQLAFRARLEENLLRKGARRRLIRLNLASIFKPILMMVDGSGAWEGQLKVAGCRRACWEYWDLCVYSSVLLLSPHRFIHERVMVGGLALSAPVTFQAEPRQCFSSYLGASVAISRRAG